MASSQNTYNVFLDHNPLDSIVVERIALKLRYCGLRSWFRRWNAIPYTQFDEQVALALSASLVVVSVIGTHGFSYWAQQPSRYSSDRVNIKPDIILLAPGLPHISTAFSSLMSDAYVVDLRNGLNDRAVWAQFIYLILQLGHQAETIINPYRSLNPKELKQNTIHSYNHIAEQFAAQWFDHPPMSPLEKFLQRLPNKAQVLDAGCGPGHHAKVLASSEHEVIGIDLSDGMLQIARRSVRTVSFEKMDIQVLSFAPKTFDAIWCAAVMLHIPREEIVSTLIGFRRVLKPAGILGLNLQIGRFSEVVECGQDNRFFEYYQNSFEVEKLLNLAGFTVEGQDYGETTRNTHELALTLKWATLYARPIKQRII